MSPSLVTQVYQIVQCFGPAPTLAFVPYKDPLDLHRYGHILYPDSGRICLDCRCIFTEAIPEALLLTACPELHANNIAVGVLAPC